MLKHISILDYSYQLPEKSIALHPVEPRDTSKLLIYNKGEISHSQFHRIPEYLPSNATLYFNNTKVIQARILFEKETGASIEIFLLNPLKPSVLLLEAIQSSGSCQWKCVIGNAKRWKEGTVLKINLPEVQLEAKLLSKKDGIVEFTWKESITFAEVISIVGNVPLPPYLNRKAMPEDKQRYQTVYSKVEGAVAAPTAGLHFTENVLNNLAGKGIGMKHLTLHVSAGTFQPVKVDNALEHNMHNEQVVVSMDIVESLLSERFVIPVGTTSMRTLESLYWFGVKLLTHPDTPFLITQEDAYQLPQEIDKKEALNEVAAYFKKNNATSITGETSIYIVPGYTFRICQALITNFHQPASTLILLVAAFIGKDWRKVYYEALYSGYRFLSYGDSSLLLPKQGKAL